MNIVPQLDVATSIGNITVQQSFMHPELARQAFQKAFDIVLSSLQKRLVSKDLFTTADRIFEFVTSYTAQAMEWVQLPGSRYAAHPPVCAVGCTSCCALSVALTPIELFAIYRYLFTQEFCFTHGEMKQRVQDYLDVRADHTIKALANINKETRQILHCPFLHDGKCTIYPVRPISCRVYMSSDLSFCQMRAANPEIHYPLNDPSIADLLNFRPLYEMGTATIWAIRAALITLRPQQSAYLELASCMQVLLTTPNPIRRWITGSNLF